MFVCIALCFYHGIVATCHFDWHIQIALYLSNALRILDFRCPQTFYFILSFLKLWFERYTKVYFGKLNTRLAYWFSSFVYIINLSVLFITIVYVFINLFNLLKQLRFFSIEYWETLVIYIENNPTAKYEPIYHHWLKIRYLYSMFL